MVVQLAKPYDEEEVKRLLQRAQYQPNPQPVQEKTNPLMDVAKAAGSSMIGKAGEAAMGKLGTAMTAPTMSAGVLGSMALPYLAGAAVLGKVFKLFNKGGQVGPLAPQYKESGGSAWSQDPLYKEWKAMYDDPTIDLSADDDFRKRMFELENILKEKYGGQMHVYKEHGGMTMPSGPLSNNKSVKMTIEYKN